MSKITIDLKVLEDCLGTLANCRSNLFLKDCVEHIDETANKIKDALAQPQQEMVAWKHDCAALLTNGVELWIDVCPHCGKPRTVQPRQKPFTYYRHYDDGVQDWPDENTIPLYASPPAQPERKPCFFCGDTGVMLSGKWRNNTGKPCTQGCKAPSEDVRLARKPLTDEQIMAIGKELGLKCRLGGNQNIDFDYARAIEAAHGIKEQK